MSNAQPSWVDREHSMGIFDRLTRSFRTPRGAKTTHSAASQQGGDWRRHKLLEAAKRHGRPFKCAAENMPREVVLRGYIVQVSDGHAADGRQP
jgi:hypothetical protein